MRAFIIRRLITGVFILFVLSVVVFLLLRIAPGDPANMRCGIGAPAGCIEAERERLGLNDPYVVQYFDWMKGVLTGDLGDSYVTRRPVIEAIQQRFPVTLELLIITILATVAIGVPFGVVSALYRNSAPDYVVRVAAVLGLAVPNFWLATLVILVPLELWQYAPPFGGAIDFFDDPLGNLRQFVPPAIVLSLASAAGIMRLTRSSLLEVLRTDYIRTARSKGLRDPVVIGRHALRNSLIPVVTVIGLQVAVELGGTIIIERIFALPGLGQYTFTALLSKDFMVVQTMVLYVGIAVVLMNLLVDISYAWLDPRIRYT
jgi:peptide/nickel transport system permease protein